MTSIYLSIGIDLVVGFVFVNEKIIRMILDVYDALYNCVVAAFSFHEPNADISSSIYVWLTITWTVYTFLVLLLLQYIPLYHYSYADQPPSLLSEQNRIYSVLTYR